MSAQCLVQAVSPCSHLMEAAHAGKPMQQESDHRGFFCTRLLDRSQGLTSIKSPKWHKGIFNECPIMWTACCRGLETFFDIRKMWGNQRNTQQVMSNQWMCFVFSRAKARWRMSWFRGISPHNHRNYHVWLVPICNQVLAISEAIVPCQAIILGALSLIPWHDWT